MSLPNDRRPVALARNLVCVLTALAVATASCSSMHKVPVVRTSAGQPVAWQVKAGDSVRVKLQSGVITEFTVQSVTPEFIIASDGTKFEHANITSVERRGYSAGKTVAAAGAGIGIVAIAIVVAGFAALFALLGGGGALHP